MFPRTIPMKVPQKISKSTNPIIIKINEAFAQFALLTGVLLLKAQISSMMKLTMGIHIKIIVMIQSPTVTTDWFCLIICSEFPC